MKRFLMPVALAGLVFCLSATVPADDFSITISVSPKMLVLDSFATGDGLTVHTDIPFSVVASVNLLIDPAGEEMDPEFIYADSRGQLVAKFTLTDIKDIVDPPAVDLTLEGRTKTGATFSGSETIQVLRLDPLRPNKN